MNIHTQITIERTQHFLKHSLVFLSSSVFSFKIWNSLQNSFPLIILNENINHNVFLNTGWLKLLQPTCFCVFDVVLILVKSKLQNKKFNPQTALWFKICRQDHDFGGKNHNMLTFLLNNRLVPGGFMGQLTSMSHLFWHESTSLFLFT